MIKKAIQFLNYVLSSYPNKNFPDEILHNFDCSHVSQGSCHRNRGLLQQTAVLDFIGVKHELSEKSLNPGYANFYVERELVYWGEPDPSRAFIPFSEEEARALWVSYSNVDSPAKKPDVLIGLLIRVDLGRKLLSCLIDIAEQYEFPGYNGFQLNDLRS